MFRQLPSRWIPALNLWNRGEPIEEIAAAYSMTTTAMTCAIGALRAKYPSVFAPREGIVAQVSVARLVTAPPTMRDKVNAALGNSRLRRFGVFPRRSGRSSGRLVPAR